ncbi:ATP-grasp domain-containing protein [Aeromicrobium sp. Sec7.5]|uniref:ATP-grasp domain-containing protein n=1 Tax=Aeromicrobium sp. Sec7.5 TaxID=3121276 RepID=UPI002FE4CBEE
MTRLAWVTGVGFAAADADLPLLTTAADRAGLASEIVVWDDPDVDWASFDLVVVRSCWDYVPRRDEFLAWADAVPRLANPAGVLRWNTDKTYLRELEAAGVAIVPTAWSVEHAEDLPSAAEWVVKPTISAGSADTARWSDPERALEHGRSLLAAGRPTMTQPYVDAVDSEGETGLLLFGGRFSHAFRKGALLTTGDDPRELPELKEDIRAREPSAEQIAFAERTVTVAAEILGSEPLYARVDVVTDADGSLRLMELELAEPSFFLDHTDVGADRLIQAALDLFRRP